MFADPSCVDLRDIDQLQVTLKKDSPPEELEK